jgi:hypothetical protein
MDMESLQRRRLAKNRKRVLVCVAETVGRKLWTGFMPAMAA